ncbi:MAG: F0F1 ATP synthase subunit delta [Candidatus Atribacteria bacterium]|nr:F0F1 ATP synthase subunit delta [Candidatus Atribacteria bacterium]
MLIDSFTVIAQIINFLILIYLLKRFLFNRIIQIMDEREKQITDRMQDAETAKEAAQKELEEQRRIREELQEKWNEMLAQAKKDAQKKREELVKDARSKIDEEQKNWREAILKQRTAFLRDLRHLSCEQVCQISRKVLADLAGEKLENQLIENFLIQLGKLSKEEKDDFVRFINKDERKIWVDSSFQLSREKESGIRKILEEIIGDKVEINFKVSPKLICGIETRTEGKKISWNIENYLDGLEEQLKKAFTEFSFQELDVEKKEN